MIHHTAFWSGAVAVGWVCVCVCDPLQEGEKGITGQFFCGHGWSEMNWLALQG